MREHWEHWSEITKNWVRCFDKNKIISLVEFEEHLSNDSEKYLHRFVKEHMHVFKCECGEVKSEVIPAETEDNKEG